MGSFYFAQNMTFMNKYFFSIVLLISIVACSFESGEIPTLEVGQEFTDSEVRVLVLDTFELQMSTFRFDSINTSDTDRLLFGQYNDEFIGTIRAEPYMELVAADAEGTTSTYELPDDAELDSIALILGYDRYHYNDTLQIMQINVHELLEEVVPEEDVFFNTSTLDFDSIPLTSRLFIPEPIDEDSLHITLPFEFGQEIFEAIQENDIEDNNDLREFLQGIVLRPSDDEDASIIGFSKDPEETYIRFFYSTPEALERVEETLDLVINPFPANPVSFHNLSLTNALNGLDGLVDQEDELLSIEAGDVSYLQSGTGLATKFTFPNLKTLFDIPGTGTILGATLEIRPLEGSDNDLTPVRDTLDTAILDRNNVIIEEIRTGVGPVQGVITGQDEEFGETTYEIPIGTFLDTKLNEESDTGTSLVIFGENFNQTLNRAVLQGESSSDFRARVIITYAIYDDDDDE